MAEKLGYVGNAPARFVRSGTSNLVGLLVPDVMNDFYSAMAQALSACLDSEGYRLVLSLTGDDRDAEARQIKELVASRVAGIILVPTAAPLRSGLALLHSVPHVQLLRRVDAVQGSWFGIDDEQSLHDATMHLLNLGHRRIGYIGGGEEFSTGFRRLVGVRRALATQELELAAVETGPPTVAFGALAAEKLLDAKHRPTAIISGSFHITMGILEAVRKRRIAVPDQLSMVGFGDAPWMAGWGPGLTTIRPPVHDLAMTCGLWFIHHVRGKAMANDESRSDNTATSQLIVRGSTSQRVGADVPKQRSGGEPLHAA